MSAHYFFRDFKKLDHLEELLRNQIQGVVDHFIPDGRYNLATRIHTTNGRGISKHPRFLCEVRLDAPQSNIPVVVKKKSSNFYSAVFQVSRVLRKILRRQSSKRAQHGKREHQRIITELLKRY